MVDYYIYGKSDRQSPEAPIPVMNIQKVDFFPGGAGNVAMNLKSLGASVTCLGYVGNDKPGESLIKVLNDEGINCNYLSTEETITTVKKRYFVNNIQTLRIDDEVIRKNWKPKSLSKLNIQSFDVIILSDYNKGVLNNDWFRGIELDNIITDPKKDNFSFYSNTGIITPNLNELKRASKININNLNSIKKACHKILSESNLKYIIAKMGEKGMMVFGKNNYVKIIDPHYVEKPDVTGAGDTVIATFSLAYSKFKDVELSAKIANAAASVVVSKKGTAVVKTKEIDSLFAE